MVCQTISELTLGVGNMGDCSGCRGQGGARHMHACMHTLIQTCIQGQPLPQEALGGSGVLQEGQGGQCQVAEWREAIPFPHSLPLISVGSEPPSIQSWTASSHPSSYRPRWAAAINN